METIYRWSCELLGFWRKTDADRYRGKRVYLCLTLQIRNNEAKYEALLVGLRLSQEMEITSLAIFVDSQLLGFDSYMIEHIRRNQNKKVEALSKLASMTFEHLTKEVLVEVLSKRSIEEKEILQVKTKEGESWMTPIHEYLVSGLLPEDPKESRKIKVKAPQYKLIRGKLYRRSFYTPWLRCVASPHTDDIVKEVHEAPGGFKFLAIAVEHSTKIGRSKTPDRYKRKACRKIRMGIRFKVMQSFSPITKHTKIMNHIKKQLAQSQKGRVDNLAQVLWIHRTHPRNSQKETPFSLTYKFEAIIPISETNVTKDDRRRIKEIDKRRGNKEVATIKEAYNRSKFRRNHSKKSSHSIYNFGDFVLLSQNNTESTQVWQGPHMASEVQGRGLYKIIDASDHSLTQTTKGTSLHKFYM
ncbi:reverse transcriptase domain-containing protein [Tanacetum coccineum]